MRLPRLALPLALTVVTLSRSALAQDTSATHREAVQQLMAVTHVKEITEQSADAILKGQLQQMPQLAPYQGILADFYHEQLSWSVLEPEYTRLYQEVFTEAEIREMITFYQTPLGQKMLARMPTLMTKSNELASRRIQAAMPQLLQRLQTAMQENTKTKAPSKP